MQSELHSLSNNSCRKTAINTLKASSSDNCIKNRKTTFRACYEEHYSMPNTETSLDRETAFKPNSCSMNC